MKCFLNIYRWNGSNGGSTAKRFATGFTLVELMIVIAIIGTLAGIAAPQYKNYLENSNRTSAKVEIKTIEKEVLSFKITRGSFPSTLVEIGLDTLKDPWGNPYQYLPVEGAQKGNLRKDHFMVPVNTDFDLYSMGPDGKTAAPFTAKASRDDIVRANNGKFVGPVIAF